jgi:hypothetical protein
MKPLHRRLPLVPEDTHSSISASMAPCSGTRRLVLGHRPPLIGQGDAFQNAASTFTSGTANRSLSNDQKSGEVLRRLS